MRKAHPHNNFITYYGILASKKFYILLSSFKQKFFLLLGTYTHFLLSKQYLFKYYRNLPYLFLQAKLIKYFSNFPFLPSKTLF